MTGKFQNGVTLITLTKREVARATPLVIKPSILSWDRPTYELK